MDVKNKIIHYNPQIHSYIKGLVVYKLMLISVNILFNKSQLLETFQYD